MWQDDLRYSALYTIVKWIRAMHWMPSTVLSVTRSLNKQWCYHFINIHLAGLNLQRDCMWVSIVISSLEYVWCPIHSVISQTFLKWLKSEFDHWITKCSIHTKFSNFYVLNVPNQYVVNRFPNSCHAVHIPTSGLFPVLEGYQHFHEPRSAKQVSILHSLLHFF